jgi:hypothetical protein
MDEETKERIGAVARIVARAMRAMAKTLEYFGFKPVDGNLR